jgi:voltage-gated potassium channel
VPHPIALDERRCEHVVMGHLRRSLDRFRANPASAKHAIAAIVSVTVATVVVGAVVVRVFDGKDYPTFGKALWFTLQTVTTVGYGDATPTTVVGRVVAAVVMLAAIALTSVVTAVITSVFVDAARADAARHDAGAEGTESRALARLEASLDDIVERLDRLESALGANSAAGREEGT